MLTNFALKTGLKQLAVLNIVLHAITLPLLLLVIYIGVNSITGFEIEHFRMAYDAISYIYVITAILLIRSNMHKELTRVLQVQKEVQSEMYEVKKEEELEKEENKEENDEDMPDISPESGQAIK